mmetsp:Transcript_32564/g.57595  ORF Transcript_32564/g.57595 Transcript_32564/m.57595 type:complete len:337 (+) Transcript_32564:70-1080(+)
MAFGRGRSSSHMASDMIDREVQEICRRWPMLLEEHDVRRLGRGRYQIDGRQVQVQVVVVEESQEDMQDSDPDRTSPRGQLEEKGGPGDLMVDSDDVVVRDGPLVQPLLDYVFNTGRNERYILSPSETQFREGPLNHVDDRLEIQYEHGLPYDPGDRISAMHLARYEVQLRNEDAHKRLSLSRETTEASEESWPAASSASTVKIQGGVAQKSVPLCSEPQRALAREPEKLGLGPFCSPRLRRPATAVVGQQVVQPRESEPISEPPDEPPVAVVNGSRGFAVTGVPWTYSEQERQQKVCNKPSCKRAPEKRRHLYDDVILPENTGNLRFDNSDTSATV